MTTTPLPLIACCQPLAAPSLTGAEAESTATLFKALGDPARVKIVNALARTDGAVCACDFEPLLGLSQPTVSHHLKKLTEAGLLEREQRGKWAFFTIKRDAVDKFAAVADLKGVSCC
jgi:ArsR family transcriptional regulator, arsenate/arsenite/antimonite-responsive transcriptional repressor